MTTPALDQFRTALLDAADRRQRPATLRRRRRGTPLLVAAAVLVLGGGTAAAVTLIASAPDDPYDPAPRSPTVIVKAHPLTRAEREALKRRRTLGAPVMDASRYFAALKGPATPSDRVPGRRDQTGVRLAASGPLGRVFIRHTAREVCVISLRGAGTSSSGSCVPTAVARTRGAFVFTQCFKTGPPQHRYVAGVVPNGVQTVSVSRAGVRQASTAVQNNGFMLDTIEPFDTIHLGSARISMPPVSC
jgi:hypothetical protein